MPTFKIILALGATGWGCIVFAQAWPLWAWLLIGTAYVTFSLAGLVAIIAWVKSKYLVEKRRAIWANHQGAGEGRIANLKVYSLQYVVCLLLVSVTCAFLYLANWIHIQIRLEQLEEWLEPGSELTPPNPCDVHRQTKSVNLR